MYVHTYGDSFNESMSSAVSEIFSVVVFSLESTPPVILTVSSGETKKFFNIKESKFRVPIFKVSENSNTRISRSKSSRANDNKVGAFESSINFEG